MSRRGRKGTEEQQARRALISELLSAANVQSMDDIQELFKETIAEFVEGSLESELDNELGYFPFLFGLLTFIERYRRSSISIGKIKN